MLDKIGAALSGGVSSVLEGTFSAYQAKKNRDFQRDMSDTAYQRSMRDMRLAGLNPILAAGKGGASTPSGAVAATPQIAPHTANALARRRFLTEQQVMESQRDKNDQDARTSSALEAYHKSNTALNKSTKKLTDNQAQATAFENSERKATSDFYENDYGDIMKEIEKLTGSAKGLGKIIEFLIKSGGKK